ncbi:putative serine-rich protein C215.13-like [Cocos nucifera]|nr:putative serine-rich protein C215.13-like [Cocos nucifera]
MDSTNSGSIQSSSSGDDCYDSRTEAISSSLNLPSQPPPPPPRRSSSHQLHHHPSPFSSISLLPRVNTFPSTPPDPNPLGLDMAWARSLPPSSLLEHSCTILDGSSSPSSKAMAIAAPSGSPPSGSSSLNQSVQPPTQPAPPASTPRGSKKRSRASRRAPTTVLATDASNFRAMVQEFTGFPAAPFISSPFSRPRLDTFHAATTASAYPFGPLIAPSLRAPLFPPISFLSSSMAHGAAFLSRNTVANANTSATSTCSNTSSSSSTTTSSSNYQLPNSIVLQHQNLLNMQSPDFTIQSSLQPQTPPYHNSVTMPAFEANPTLGPSGLAAGGLGSLFAMEGLKPSRRSADGFLGWADGSASTEDRDRSRFRSVIGNYDNLQQVSNHAEKGSESMTLTRGSEGKVDPWILSSD